MDGTNIKAGHMLVMCLATSMAMGFSFTPQGCDGDRTFCDEVVDYPDPDTVEQIIRSSGSANPLLRTKANMFRATKIEPKAGLEEALPLLTHSEPYESDEGSTGWEPVCASEHQTRYIAVAKNEANQFRFILNNEEYQQEIRIELCLNHTIGMPCRVPADGLIRTKCQQKYSPVRLISFTDAGNLNVTDRFLLPSGCACYRSTYAEVLSPTQPNTTATVKKQERDIDQVTVDIENQIETDHDETARSFPAEYDAADFAKRVKEIEEQIEEIHEIRRDMKSPPPRVAFSYQLCVVTASCLNIQSFFLYLYAIN